VKLPNLAQRVFVAIFGIPLILSSLYFGGYPLLCLVLIINTVSQYEFYKLAEKKGTYPLKSAGLLFGISVPFLFYYKGISILAWLLIGSLLIVLLIELFRNKQNALQNVAVTFFGIVYPTIFFSFVILIREISKRADILNEQGGILLIAVFIIIWICDTAAFFVGKAVGKHKLYERISPHKTMEGGIAGFIGAIVTAYIFYLLYPQLLSLYHFLIIGTIVGIFSQIGDLVESLFKRDALVKDSSAILPGHGGFMDRFDAPIFLAPLIYFYLIAFVF